MKNKKRILTFLLLVIFSIVSLYANYRIVDYKIRVEVSEDYVLNVSEDYIFEFDTPRHGFYRVIPYQNYPDHNVKVSNIDVEGGNYKIEKSGGLLTIRVGDADVTVSGKQSYSIAYKFDIGADKYEDFDEFYFNIIGTMWECPIENASFEVIFPKPINEDMIFLTVGTLNSTNVDDSWKLSADKTIVSGSLSNLSISEGATLRCEMEDGYFVGARDYRVISKIMAIVLVIVNLILLVFAYLIFNKYGRDDKVIERSRFTAPDGFTPLSLDYFIHNLFTSSSYSASFIYWADNGFIDIKQYEDESVRLIRKVDFAKVKKDKNHNLDYKLFNAIFRGTQIGEEVDLETLDSEALGVSLASLGKAGAKQFDSKLLNDSKASKMRAFIFLFAMLSAGVSLLFTYVSSSAFMPLGLVASFFYLVLSTIILSTINSRWSLYSVLKKILIVFGIFALTIVYAFVSYINIYLLRFVSSDINMIVTVVSTISLLAFVILFSLTEKRSQYSQTALEELLGYKSFLKLVEVDKIEKLVDENPKFYFEHLGYAQVMDLTKTWEKKFARIDMIQPSWYICPTYGLYTYARINNVSSSLNKSLNVPLAAYAQKHASSGSSSSGFSGSVGGGAGGGGGGAW